MKILTALVTPFLEDFRINYEMLDILINKQINEGADGIIIGGTTGEISTLDKEEVLELYQFVSKYNSQIPIYLGISGISTKTLQNQIISLDNLNVSGYLIVVPYYVIPPQKGLIEHFKILASTTSKEIIIYNIPKRTGSNLTIASLKALSEIPNINKLKEANPNKRRIKVIKNELNLEILLGNDNLFIWGIKNQIPGIISVISNTDLKLMKECLIDKGKYCEYLKTLKQIESDVNPIGIKKRLKALGFNVGLPRLPLIE